MAILYFLFNFIRQQAWHCLSECFPIRQGQSDRQEIAPDNQVEQVTAIAAGSFNRFPLERVPLRNGARDLSGGSIALISICREFREIPIAILQKNMKPHQFAINLNKIPDQIKINSRPIKKFTKINQSYEMKYLFLFNLESFSFCFSIFH